MARILVVDDEAGIRSFLSGALAAVGHDVDEAADGEEALRRLAAKACHLVITDLRMPRLDGMALLARLRAEAPEVEVIVLTAHGTVETAVQAMKLGAFDYLEKPISGPTELRLLVERALERHRLHAAREAAARPKEDEARLSHGAKAMEAVVLTLRRVAATDTTVLLLGESGTGKEVAASAVHRMSPRSQGPFVAVNCAALAETLLESELFGHERGAFTGATTRRRGRLELAEGGTFFLDEIGELKPPLQAKLLRVLQERRFERVGGNQVVACDVRWIAATNRDLGAMMRRGDFREDLYHRLAVFPLRLPPLRERREEIAPLARDLLARISASLGRPAISLHPDAVAVLERHGWPGNVRELANVLERAAILTDGTEVRPEHLWLEPSGVAAVPADGGTTMADLEREAIRRTLAEHGGNRRRAAAALGIGLRTLYEKLRRYGIG
ncbi:MAG: sigma-54-dependent Fis family transcriptional regulator [Deltaproteobacteria bacterium]|nr:sigma-54-dependent Fis family transcriptional regulator [Deltaproteobacteria bacterium]